MTEQNDMFVEVDETPLPDMYTSCHFTYSGPGRVVISRGCPRRMAGGYKMYRKLAPTRDILALNAVDEYKPRFREEVLGRLDPDQVIEDLLRLAQPNPPVLLCFEKPPITPANFCHRRMVADWLWEERGINAPELGGGDHRCYGAGKRS